MEGVREFLESSTIHGLIYISTTGTRLTILFWFLVVLGGFTASYVFISNSFYSWEKSPISTSIETFPISNVTFPLVSVCPPKGTNTALNLDILKFENKSISNSVRSKLLKYAGWWLQDEQFKTVSEEEKAFKETRHYRNLYEGISWHTLSR